MEKTRSLFENEDLAKTWGDGWAAQIARAALAQKGGE